MGLLAETFAGLQAKFTPALASAGLSVTDFEVLLRLSRSAGHRLRMTDLATQAALSTSGLTRVVDRLPGRGLVRPEGCAADRQGAFPRPPFEAVRRASDHTRRHVGHRAPCC